MHVFAPRRSQAYLLIGAPLARLAREAERIHLPVQLKSGLEERLRRERQYIPLTTTHGHS